MRIKLILLIVVFFLGSFTRADPPPVEQRPEEFPPASDPAAAFERYNEAWNLQDWPALYAVLSPDQRDYLLFEAAFAMGSGAASEEAERITAKYLDEARLEQLLSGKAPPTTEEVASAYAKSIEDKRGMFIECYRYLHARNPETPRNRYGGLNDLQITGAAASARAKETSTVVGYLSKGGRTTRQNFQLKQDVTLYFIRLDGGWLFATQEEWREASKTRQ